MAQPKPKHFGFVVKHSVSRASDVAIAAADWLESKGAKVTVASEAEEFLQKRPHSEQCPKEEIPVLCDVAVVFGGDGTFLSIARQMIWKSIPILGINLGQLGFLTEVMVEELYTSLESVLNGEFEVQERTMLEACVDRAGNQLFCLPVLNDIVVNKSAIARVIEFELSVNETLLARVKADGLIVSTPTGSTAYSLAAGGPITHPEVKAIIVTSICPHTLSMRPIVVPDDAVIDLEVLNIDGGIVLTLDGQTAFDILKGDRVRVRKFHRHCVKVIKSTHRDYFALMRTKFFLGARG